MPTTRTKAKLNKKALFVGQWQYRRGKFMLVDESSNGTYVEMEDSGKPIYVRNEAFALVGSGRFSLGTRPEGDKFAVSFVAS